jgi:hypothetical protein
MGKSPRGIFVTCYLLSLHADTTPFDEDLPRTLGGDFRRKMEVNKTKTNIIPKEKIKLMTGPRLI